MVNTGNMEIIEMNESINMFVSNLTDVCLKIPFHSNATLGKIIDFV